MAFTVLLETDKTGSITEINCFQAVGTLDDAAVVTDKVTNNLQGYIIGRTHRAGKECVADRRESLRTAGGKIKDMVLVRNVCETDNLMGRVKNHIFGSLRVGMFVTAHL